MGLFEDLTWRGLVNQVTHPELGALLEKERFTFYSGFDPTAESLHIGNLLAIVGMMRFQRAGHRPIGLVGGCTGLIGDPSGKSEERRLLTRDEVDVYVAGVKGQLMRFLDTAGPNGAIFVNNADWLSGLSLIEFLRDVGKHFSINVMLARDSVRQRLEDREHGISYTEFSYILLQSYDFLHLCDTHDCRLQIGGSDQWGNIVSGMDLTRRLRQKDTFGMTFPLLTKSDGSKFGKSESGNVWLDAKRTSPYRFYQFWINQADADTLRLLRYFTFLSPSAIAELERAVESEPEKRVAQRRLAEEVTTMVHGEAAMRNALRASEALFGGDLKGLDEPTLEDVFSEAPSTTLPRTYLAGDTLLVDVLVEMGVFPSKGEARRMISSGGLYLNNERVSSDDAKLNAQSLVSEHVAILRKGKRNYHLLKFVA